MGGRALHRGRPRAPGRRPAEVPRRRRARRSSGTPRTTSRASTSTSSRPSSTRPSCRASTPRSAPARPGARSSPPTSSPPPRWWAGSSARAAARSCEFSQLADALEARFGKQAGRSARSQDFRAAEDPEAPVTVFEQRFPYQAPPKRPAGRRPPRHGHAEAQRHGHDRLLLPRHARRAPPTRCWWPARESASGHPLMVAGPQVGYFNPQILMEQDVHAPASRGRPGDRRPGRLVRRHQPLRPARPRARLRVERDLRRPGHHRHLRARALRRHALPLPRPCEPIEVLEKTNRWVPTLGRPDHARLAEAARRAHQARARRRARQGRAASR